MQQRLLRNAVVLALIGGLALIAICYIYGFSSPRTSSPGPKQTALKKETPPKPSEKPSQQEAVDSKAVVNASKAPEQSSEPADSKVLEQSQTQVETTALAEPQAAVVTKSVPVSRSQADTYSSNSSYPQLSKQQGSFGQFRYRDTSGGRIEIDPQWVDENIVTIVLPGLNRRVQVHKDAADNYIAAFNYIKNGTAVINGREVPLLSLIKTMDGTFVSRHVNWNPSRGLSNHSWGIAIDINAADHFGYANPTSNPDDPNVILWEKAFKPAGFSWGNRYADSMHFELLY